MTNIYFDDESLVPRPLSLDVPEQPLERNEDLPAARAAFMEGVGLLERQALRSSIVDMGRVSAEDWRAAVRYQCERYLSRPTAVSPLVADEIVPQLEAMVRESGYSEMLVHVFDQLRPRLIARLREQLHIEGP